LFIKKEEQFMGRKVIKYEDLYGYEDVLHVINGDEGYEDGWYLKEIEMDFGNGKKLADALIAKGYEVKYDEDMKVWESGDSHWNDCYWYPYTN
jgi:hypothetical protein